MDFIRNFFKQKITVRSYKFTLLITSYCLIAFAIGFLIAHSQFILDFRADLKKLRNYKTTTIDKTITTWIDDEERSHNGLVLISPFLFDKSHNDNPALMLVNKKGQIVHKWFFKYKEKNSTIIDHFELYNNGDILFSNSNRQKSSKRSKLTKLDKNSNLLWEIEGDFHHWFDGQNTKYIYALEKKLSPLIKISPYLDFSKNKQALYHDDLITIIHNDTGKIIKRIALSEAFLKSDYVDYLNLGLTQRKRDSENRRRRDSENNFDILHGNTVRYLDNKLSKNLPFSKEGDLLLSFRQLDLIAILRPSEEKIVWAQRGPWRAQHHIEVLPNGMMLLFDNEGGAIITNNKDSLQTNLRSRLLEFDPKTKSTKTIFHDNKKISFFSHWLSGFQELDNGHFIIFFSAKSRIIEIDKKGNIVWELRGIKNRNQELVHYLYKIPQAIYFKKSQLNFIK